MTKVWAQANPSKDHRVMPKKRLWKLTEINIVTYIHVVCDGEADGNDLAALAHNGLELNIADLKLAVLGPEMVDHKIRTQRSMWARGLEKEGEENRIKIRVKRTRRKRLLSRPKPTPLQSKTKTDKNKKKNPKNASSRLRRHHHLNTYATGSWAFHFCWPLSAFRPYTTPSYNTATTSIPDDEVGHE
jgi:hypothetical protein